MDELVRNSAITFLLSPSLLLSQAERHEMTPTSASHPPRLPPSYTLFLFSQQPTHFVCNMKETMDDYFSLLLSEARLKDLTTNISVFGADGSVLCCVVLCWTFSGLCIKHTYTLHSLKEQPSSERYCSFLRVMIIDFRMFVFLVCFFC